MDIYETRKARLWRLIESEFDGSKSRFADKAKLGNTPEGSRTQVRRWFPVKPEAATRNIEYDSARRIEERLDLIPLCLDNFDLQAPYRSRDEKHGDIKKSNGLLLLPDSPPNRAMHPPHRAAEPTFEWPFPLVDKERWNALLPKGKEHVQLAMNNTIALCESAGLVDASRSKRPA